MDARLAFHNAYKLEAASACSNATRGWVITHGAQAIKDAFDLVEIATCQELWGLSGALCNPIVSSSCIMEQLHSERTFHNQKIVCFFFIIVIIKLGMFKMHVLGFYRF